MSVLPKDWNGVPALAWVSSASATTILPIKINPVTWRVLVEATWWAVAWPWSSTDNAIVRFDWTGWATIQDSWVTITDNWKVMFVAAAAWYASMNIPTSAATDPSSPNEWDLWYNGTNLYFEDSAGSQDLLAWVANTLTSSAVITDHALVRWDWWARWTQDTWIAVDDSDNVSWVVNLAQTWYTDITEIAAPWNPAANNWRLYVADDWGTTTLYFKDSAWTTTDLLAGWAWWWATTALDNLASVAINTSLVSDTDNTDDLGTAAIGWRDIFLGNTSVITWSTAPFTADVTLTHAANSLTFAWGTIALWTATATWGLTWDVTWNCSWSSGSTTWNAATATELETARTIWWTLFDWTADITVASATGWFAVTWWNLTLDTNDFVVNTDKFVVDWATWNTIALWTIDIWHATDTTISRDSAWVIAVQWIIVPTVSSSSTFTTKTIDLDSNTITWTLAEFNAALQWDSFVSLTWTETLTNKTLTAPAIWGVAQLAEDASIWLDATLSDWSWSWVTITWTLWATVAFGELIYLDPTASKWLKVEISAAAAADWDARTLIWICVDWWNDTDSTTILLQWNVRADSEFTTLTIWAAVYAWDAAWDIQTSAPATSWDISRIVGYALTANELYFSPSADFITIA